MQRIKLKELAHFGQAVRHHRLTRELSQEQLAHVCELDRTYIGGVERGERNVSLINIWKIANALKIKPAALFTEVAE
jgi:transcriptional regulator with XRE-family HTH domain